jgi:hypothetical protein
MRMTTDRWSHQISSATKNEVKWNELKNNSISSVGYEWVEDFMKPFKNISKENLI